MVSQTSKEIVRTLFQFKELQTIPFIPLVSSFAAKLEQIDVGEMLREPSLLSRSLMNAQKLCGYDAIASIFDLSLEAEACGCEIEYGSEDEPPRVVTHPFKTSVDAESVDISELETMGRLPVVLEATKRINIIKGKQVTLIGIVTGPVTLTKQLMGDMAFEKLDNRPEDTIAIIEFAGEILLKLCHEYFAHGADMIGIADPALREIPVSSFPLIAPIFRTIANVIQYYKSHSIIFAGECDRDYIEPIFELESNGIVVGGNTDLNFAKSISTMKRRCLGIGIPSADLISGESKVNESMRTYLPIMENKGIFISTEFEVPYTTQIHCLRDAMKSIRKEV